MKHQKGEEIRQLFINLTHVRGLLWPDEVEGILFDYFGNPRHFSSDVKIDPLSLSTRLALNSSTEVINYILVIDYFVDYLKTEYDFRNGQVTVLLRDYLLECHVMNFEKLTGPIGTWLIPSDFIVDMNPLILKFSLSKMFLWKLEKKLKFWKVGHIILKFRIFSQKKRGTLYHIIYSFLQDDFDSSSFAMLFSDYKDNTILWEVLISRLNLYFLRNKKRTLS